MRIIIHTFKYGKEEQKSLHPSIEIINLKNDIVIMLELVQQEAIPYKNKMRSTSSVNTSYYPSYNGKSIIVSSLSISGIANIIQKENN